MLVTRCGRVAHAPSSGSGSWEACGRGELKVRRNCFGGSTRNMASLVISGSGTTIGTSDVGVSSPVASMVAVKGATFPAWVAVWCTPRPSRMAQGPRCVLNPLCLHGRGRSPPSKREAPHLFARGWDPFSLRSREGARSRTSGLRGVAHQPTTSAASDHSTDGSRSCATEITLLR